MKCFEMLFFFCLSIYHSDSFFLSVYLFIYIYIYGRVNIQVSPYNTSLTVLENSFRSFKGELLKTKD